MLLLLFFTEPIASVSFLFKFFFSFLIDNWRRRSRRRTFLFYGSQSWWILFLSCIAFIAANVVVFSCCCIAIFAFFKIVAAAIWFRRRSWIVLFILIAIIWATRRRCFVIIGVFVVATFTIFRIVATFANLAATSPVIVVFVVPFAATWSPIVAITRRLTVPTGPITIGPITVTASLGITTVGIFGAAILCRRINVNIVDFLTLEVLLYILLLYMEIWPFYSPREEQWNLGNLKKRKSVSGFRYQILSNTVF